jgi:hypothetical protein
MFPNDRTIDSQSDPTITLLKFEAEEQHLVHL